MKNDFVLIFLAPLSVFALIQLTLAKPSFFIWTFSLTALAILFSIKRLSGKSIKSSDYWLSSILPLLLTFSISSYGLIMPLSFITHLLLIFLSILLFYYLKNISLRDNKLFLENISSYGSFLISFFSFSFLYGLKSFLGVDISFLIIAIMAVSILIYLGMLWANQIKIRVAAPYLILASLMTLQISWSLYFLSLGHNFSGLILAIYNYMLMGMIKPLLRGSLSKRTVKLYLICGLCGIFAVIISAKWL